MMHAYQRPIPTTAMKLMAFCMLTIARFQRRWPKTHWIKPLGWRRKSIKPLRLCANRDIRRGEELVFSYHRHGQSNVHMLADYGFVPFMSMSEGVALFSNNDEALAWLEEQV